MQPTQTVRPSFTSKSNKENTMNRIVRIIITVSIVLASSLFFTTNTSAAPVRTYVPEGLIQLGEPQVWHSHIMQKSHRLDMKDFIAPEGTVYATLQVKWSSETNDGDGNESTSVKSSIGEFSCKDGDLVTGSNADYICIDEGAPFSGNPFMLTLVYDGPGGFGDSHSLEAIVTFYGIDRNYVTTTTFNQPNNNPNTPNTNAQVPTNPAVIIPAELPRTATNPQSNLGPACADNTIDARTMPWCEGFGPGKAGSR